ncbi:MAG TPA: hypothetical protein VM326_02345 [Sphingomicrobium sp.]|nr:hypothetical protein [Sphingomicrobium sp.]
MTDPDDVEEIRVRLRAIVAGRRGWSATARASGVDRCALHRALRPGARPSLSTIVRVANACGLKLTLAPR